MKVSYTKGVLFMSKQTQSNQNERRRMNKRFISLILSVMLIFGCIAPCSVVASGINVTLNGNCINFDQPPVMVSDRVLVPVRAIFEAMGFVVMWDGTTQMVNVITEFGVMTLAIGSPYISYRNETEDKSVVCDVPPQIINGRTLVPARAIAECTGYKVDWDNSTQTVIITGDAFKMTLPEADIAGYYPNTKTPDFGACFNITTTKVNDLGDRTEYCYNGVTGKQVVEYIETHLASVGYTISDEQDIWGLFRFIMENGSTGERITVSYQQSDKYLMVNVRK